MTPPPSCYGGAAPNYVPHCSFAFIEIIGAIEFILRKNILTIILRFFFITIIFNYN